MEWIESVGMMGIEAFCDDGMEKSLCSERAIYMYELTLQFIIESITIILNDGLVIEP